MVHTGAILAQGGLDNLFFLKQLSQVGTCMSSPTAALTGTTSSSQSLTIYTFPQHIVFVFKSYLLVLGALTCFLAGYSTRAIWVPAAKKSKDCLSPPRTRKTLHLEEGPYVKKNGSHSFRVTKLQFTQ